MATAGTQGKLREAMEGKATARGCEEGETRQCTQVGPLPILPVPPSFCPPLFFLPSPLLFFLWPPSCFCPPPPLVCVPLLLFSSPVCLPYPHRKTSVPRAREDVDADPERDCPRAINVESPAAAPFLKFSFSFY